MNKVFAVPAIAFAAGLGLAACGSNSQPGYLNPTTLQKTIDGNIVNTEYRYVGVSHTVCVPDGTTDQFICSTTISSKTGNVELDSMSATITVSPDGKTWVATNEQSSGG